MNTLMQQCISSLEAYPNSKDFRIRILKGDKKTMEQIQSLVCNTLSSPSSTPISKLLAVRLAKDCMETYNDEFIMQSQITILPQFEEIALFDREFKDGNRGRNFFSEQPNAEQAQYGISLLRLVLECLWVWAKWFPVDPDTNKISMYKLTLEKLIKLGVIFPKLVYFDFSEVTKQMPDQQVPVKMLREAKRILSDDYINTRGSCSPSKRLVGYLNIGVQDVPKGNDVFPADRIKKAIKSKQGVSQKKVDQSKVLHYKSFSQNQLKAEIVELIKKKQQIEQELTSTTGLIDYLKDAIKNYQEQPAYLNLNVPAKEIQNSNGPQTGSSSPMGHTRTTNKRDSMTSSLRRSQHDQVPQPNGLSFTDQQQI